MINIQHLLDGIGAEMQQKRSETQLTLGALIKALSEMPAYSKVANLHSLRSYRGYYSDLAFEHSVGERPSIDLWADCKNAMGQVFEGYKGGEFVMGAKTPLWISEYGESSGIKLMAVHADGTVEVEQEKWD